MSLRNKAVNALMNGFELGKLEIAFREALEHADTAAINAVRDKASTSLLNSLERTELHADRLRERGKEAVVGGFKTGDLDDALRQPSYQPAETAEAGRLRQKAQLQFLNALATGGLD